ncbi:PBP1A family penicillin-binding protein [Roseomonas marmotae]|uniref:peptidoglycan glycosyltransferase n=1 Tax=Roseomonas marmotae TaxID=2768161 RepID=A0ABS3KH99_9PROT|nr:PBP1A family penicillin-binding protein [Roseomonas marmotae]MBO1076367.1 PBP1A family penicillin-binding protein [Roseomonas marmotae]QTI79423.1 PBP1A family penicillin-binding protein [Roseomonas marmotae]
MTESRTTPRRRLLPRLPLLLGGGMGVVALGLVVYLGWCLLQMPVGGGMQPTATAATLILENRDGTGFATRGVLRGEPVSADALPQPLTDAIIAIEDRRFYSHHGIDPRGILRAVTRAVSSGRLREGASTITQQLARMTYLSQEKTLSRKVQEAMLALWLESRLSKQEILARYMNTAYFGAGAVGVDAAARRYFGKSAGDVTLAEAAMLAGLLRAPSALAPTTNMEGAWQRANVVLQVMQETGLATPEQVAAARAAPPVLKAPPEPLVGRGYFSDWADAEARRLVGPMPVDLSVRTTLDPALQDLAEKVVTRHLAQTGGKQQAGQAALLALAPDGSVLAMVGGRDYAESQFNRTSQARRQPGSLFKLFVYAAALEEGWRPDQTIQDTPITIDGWSPGNSGGRYRGAMTLREAFAQSSNTAAVRLQEAVGRDKVAAMARRLGLSAEMPLNPSMALGTTEATLAEMVTAFGRIGYGTQIEPYVVQEVRARDRALYTRPPAPTAPLVPPRVQQGMLDMMLAVVRDGTGRAARLERPVAGKTGTTQDSRDAWFIGMTADAVVGVWVGNDDNSPTKNVHGGGLPARIWRDFMEEADKLHTAAAPSAAVQPSPAREEQLRGVPQVLDTATLLIGGREVRLAGLVGLPSGDFVAAMTQWISGREAVCEARSSESWECRVGGRSLSELVLSNGGGRASTDAPPELRQAERAARQARLGIWGG